MLRLLIIAITVAISPAAAQQKVNIPSLDGRLTLDGYWFRANQGAEARPAVIALHGCGGALTNAGLLPLAARREAGDFNAEGIHYLVLDSFTTRGAQSICEIPSSRRSIHEEDRRRDVFAAIQWLSRQHGVDATRTAIIGRSHGGSTVLSVVDATDGEVQAQPLAPRAAIALYPGCIKFTKMFNYAVRTPLLMLAGALDNWTPASQCEDLQAKIKRADSKAPSHLTIYPESHHAFDSTTPVRVRTGVGNTLSGTASVGGNPVAREAARQATFEFLAREFGITLRYDHATRFHTHRKPVPAASGFAEAHDIARVPLSEKGRERYNYYTSLPTPKAFVITTKGGWYMMSDDANAVPIAFDLCRENGVECWLYAVDSRVVWTEDVSKRIGPEAWIKQ